MIYVFLIINLIINILITIILCISSRNIKLLLGYQKAYLIFAIILWIGICLFYFLKLLSLIYGQVTGHFFINYQLKEKVIIIWGITNGGAYLFTLIGFIYDIALLLKGEITSVIYPIIYFVIFFIYFILSLIDFFFIESTVRLIINARKPDSKEKNKSKHVEKEEETNNDENKKKAD